ncbi:TlpA family protein disulfide reductase [Cryobacterium sp. 1639]|uniref:TlpA family protein disulfide reductase n=1 Tax=Cryobacterium inferilacus TaxID=2866629 RepID=UPI001C734B38|nr:TlpA disulfide reductase family protein [Cryobacterium sp. 1639]MBX0301751.1 TlpA family protein disulfide reductase [Cryobacterium sp. 1639]
MTRRPRRSTAALAGAVALGVALTGCSTSDDLARQYTEGGNKGYIAGDGSVTEIPVEERGDPVVFDGTVEDGSTVSSADYAGEVLVVNFWYASCAPCRAEAPDLKDISEQFAGDGASFLGVNVRDQAASAIAFNESYSIGYPSVMDVDDGGMQLAFSGNIPPNAVPTTLVLDGSGRVAARILGQVSAPSILETLIEDTIAEDG